MTVPGDMTFISAGTDRLGQGVDLDTAPKHDTTPMGARAEIPPPIMPLDDEVRDALIIWLEQWLLDLENAQADPMRDWAEYEKLYRALPDPGVSFRPFEGSSIETIPVGGMAVDPIFARLDTGIFKQKPVFTFTALRADMKDIMPAMEKFVEFYQKNKLKLR